MPDDRSGLGRDKPHLIAAGVPRRYLVASMEEVTPELHEDVSQYCVSIMQHMKDGYGMVIIGPWGCGKTMAAVAILDHLLTLPGRVLGWIDGPDLDPVPMRHPYYEPYTGAFALPLVLSNVLHRPSQGDNAERIARWTEADLLVIDDFHKLYLGAEWDRNQLENLLDVRHAEMRSTILTLNDDTVLQRPDMGGMRDRLKETAAKIILGGDVPSRRGGA